MTHGPSLSHPSQPVVTSRDPYLRVYFAQISPFDFWAEMKAINEHERLSPKFPSCAKFHKEICLLAVRNSGLGQHTRQVRSERQVAVRAQRARGTVTLRGRDYAPSHAAAAVVALANLARALLSALKTPRAPLRTHADVMRCA